MKTKVHSLFIEINWQLISWISQIDRFDAQWTNIEKREGQSLKQLKSIATVRSVGASTRIEGAKLSDKEVEEETKRTEAGYSIEDSTADEKIAIKALKDLQ